MNYYATLFAVVVFCAVGSAQTTQPSRPTAQPSPEQLLNQLLAPAQQTAKPLSPANEQQTDKTSGAGATAPNAPTLTLLREGTYIVDRVGQIKQDPDGRIEFLFDADGKAMQDPPMFLLPNLMLMSMQTAAAGSDRDLHFRITGMVTEYNGRNYVLLDKVVVVPSVAQPLK